MTAPCPLLGFVVTIALRNDADRAQVVASLIDVLERHDLSGLVRGARSVEVVIRRDGAQATDADRDLVRTWSAEWTPRASIIIGDVVDLTTGA
jgi:hypothetical protein